MEELEVEEVLEKVEEIEEKKFKKSIKSRKIRRIIRKKSIIKKKVKVVEENGEVEVENVEVFE